MAQAKAKANKKNNSLPSAGDIPAGMKQLGGGYAASWSPNEGDSIHGKTTGEVKTVSIKRGRKTQESRCVEITDDATGERHTVWEAAALVDLFDALTEAGEGTEVFIRFDGLGKAKAGQNPPKRYTVAVAA